MTNKQEIEVRQLVAPMTEKKRREVESRMAKRTGRLVELNEKKQAIVKPTNDELKHMKNEDKQDARLLAEADGVNAHVDYRTNTTWHTNATTGDEIEGTRRTLGADERQTALELAKPVDESAENPLDEPIVKPKRARRSKAVVVDAPEDDSSTSDLLS